MMWHRKNSEEQSIVWMHFWKVTSWYRVKAQCELCNKTTSGNTTNLLRHLTPRSILMSSKILMKKRGRKRSLLHRKSKPESLKATLTEIAWLSAVFLSWKINDFRSWWNSYLICCGMKFDIGPHFLDISLHKEMKQKVNGKLMSLQLDTTKISLTTDMWISDDMPLLNSRLHTVCLAI